MTELIWEGKYDANGKKVAPVRIALPFQTIETVNESAEDRKKTLDMFASGRETEWRNRLIWGDKKYVLPSLLPEFAGKVNLIYIDPPFDTGADFSYTAEVHSLDADDENDAEFVKAPSLVELKAYRDTWGEGLNSYAPWFYDTAILLRDLLADDGFLFVHLDWHVGHYAKVILDEVFGIENFRNEVIWYYPGRERKSENKFQSKHDVIMLYGKTERAKLNKITKPWDKEGRVKALRRKIHKDPDGREWFWETRGQAQGIEPYKRYLDEYVAKGGALNDVWDDIQFLRGNHPERVGYDTQKPEELVTRIIEAGSKPGELVLDCFCGSGTTAVAAEKAGRRWIACDLGRYATHVTRKRLLGIESVKPFVVQNLGKYERQAWAKDEFRDPKQRAKAEKTYRNFILDLYHAQPIDGYTWLHGAKGGRMVHVGAVDSPVAIGDIKAIVQEFWKTVGKSKHVETNGVDVLGWEFAFDINETARQIAAENKIDLKTKKIPREVLEKKAVEQGDIKFYELAYLNIRTKAAKKKLTLELKDFIMPPDDIPEEVLDHINHWSQWIDYWAVDWDFKGDTFHNEWQSYRTKKDPTIELKVEHEYESAGKRTVLVKVIDILGNDTTKAISIEA